MSNPYVCALCQAVFQNMAELDAHYRGVHGEYVETVPEPTVLICYICLWQTTSDTYLKKHLLEVHNILPEGWFRCPICSAVFSSQANLDGHIAGTHQSGPTPPPPDMPPTLPPADPTWTPPATDYQCPICGAHFTNTVDLNAHYFAVHTSQGTPTPLVPQETIPGPGRACMLTFILAPLGLQFILPYIRKIRDSHIPGPVQRAYYGLSARLLAPTTIFC